MSLNLIKGKVYTDMLVNNPSGNYEPQLNHGWCMLGVDL